MTFASWLRSFHSLSARSRSRPTCFAIARSLVRPMPELVQPACAVAHLLPVRLLPRVAVLLEQVEDLGLCHGTRSGADSSLPVAVTFSQVRFRPPPA